jgi:outer membrane protein TolC
MRLSLTLSLVLFTGASLRAEAPPIQGTLPEDLLPGLAPLLKEAVERSPTSISASIAVAAQQAADYSSAAALWPKLSGNMGYQVSDESISRGATSSARGLNYGLNLGQPIFQWGAYRNGKLIGDLNVRIAEKQFGEAYRLLAVSIREQYMTLIGKKIALRNAQFSLKMSQEGLQAQQARFDAGSSSVAELGDFKITVEQAQLDADRAQEDFSYAMRVFTRLVGIDSLAEDSIPVVLPHPEYSAPLADTVLTGFVGEGIESTFQSEVYQMELRQAELNYKIAKVGNLPKVNAAAAYSYSNQTSVSQTSISQVGVQEEIYSISAGWSIFDGFATRGAKLSALASKRLTERNRQSYIDSTIDSVSDMRKQLGFSSRAMSIAEVHNALIADEVKRLGQDRDLGYASQATIDAGVLNLYATELLMAGARSDYLDRWTEFISLAGIDPALANLSSRYAR